MRGLGKVEKVFLGNTNIQYTLVGENAEIGNVRETFFYNQLHVTHDVMASRVSDFCVDDYTFEVGGKKKGKKQISDVKNGYVVRDEIEYATQQIIPSGCSDCSIKTKLSRCHEARQRGSAAFMFSTVRRERKEGVYISILNYYIL